MATSDKEMDTDPITAALPPNSDYITYLTILEYQLTPNRLSILTRHLANDDGTLAKEIGWDLVKLILPLLDAAPEDAAKCLEVVARRGNPREVVIRVAEALEIVGADDGATESGSEQEFAIDKSPTFVGEAQQIHFGNTELEGMPQAPSKQQNSMDMPMTGPREGMTTISASSDLQFSTLLSMLGLLHSRIKTQYPSRFLATSLPAALGAYRRIPITSQTTIAFVALLGKLSGKQRPTLPPRSSTTSAAHLHPPSTPGTQVYAPLPDPEGQSEANAKTPSDLEMSIVLRLLQAVTLEVLEEYLLADPSTMEWSTRLLERQNSSKAIPDRKSRSKTWQDDENLQYKDIMMEKFLRLAKDLRMSPEDVFRSTNLPLVRDKSQKEDITEASMEKDEVEEPSEFPTSPTQIPYSHLGALFLFLASKVPAVVYSNEKTSSLDISISDLHHFVNQFVVPTPTLITDQLIPSVIHNPPSAIDALLSLLHLTLAPQDSNVGTSDPTTDADYKSLISILSYLSAEHPEPSCRTSAHYLATTLLHSHPSSTFRLAIIKSTITDCGHIENLKEVAIGWLKEEILFTISPAKPTSSSRHADETQSKYSSSSGGDNILASTTLFADDESLGSLIFPPTSIPPITSSESEKPEPPNQKSLTLPIASLNLLFLLLTNPTLATRYNFASRMTDLQSSPSTSEPRSFEAKALHFATSLQKYIDENAGKGSKEEEGKLGLLALAVGRVVGALEGYQKRHRREQEHEQKQKQRESSGGAQATA